jgi:hypothetical protein
VAHGVLPRWVDLGEGEAVGLVAGKEGVVAESALSPGLVEDPPVGLAAGSEQDRPVGVGHRDHHLEVRPACLALVGSEELQEPLAVGLVQGAPRAPGGAVGEDLARSRIDLAVGEAGGDHAGEPTEGRDNEPRVLGQGEGADVAGVGGGLEAGVPLEVRSVFFWFWGVNGGEIVAEFPQDGLVLAELAGVPRADTDGSMAGHLRARGSATGRGTVRGGAC